MGSRGSQTAGGEVVLLHGTKIFPRLMGTPAWVRPGSEMRMAIETAVPGQRVWNLEWRGGNRFLDRRNAAIDLADRLRRSSTPVTVVAHSHGGNVALDAVRRSGLEPDQVSVVTIGTPFLSLTDLSDATTDYRGRMFVLVFVALAAGIWLARPPGSGVVGFVLTFSVPLLLALSVISVEPHDDLATLRNQPALRAPVTVVSVPRDEAALALRAGRVIDRAGRTVESAGWFPLVLIGFISALSVGTSVYGIYSAFVEQTGRQPSTEEDFRWITSIAAEYIREEYPFVGPVLLVGSLAALAGLAVVGVAYWSCGFDGLSFASHGHFCVTATPQPSANIHHIVKAPTAGGLKHTALTSDPAVIDLVVTHLRS